MKLFDKKDKDSSAEKKLAGVEQEAVPTPIQSLDVLSELVGRMELNRNAHVATLNHVENVRKALSA